MEREFDGPLERPKASRVLAEVRRTCTPGVIMNPGRKMEAAFSLSMDARMLLVAGLKAQGFSEAEILALKREKP
jgi:hypothetical protein